MQRILLALTALLATPVVVAGPFDPEVAISDQTLASVAGMADLNQQSRSNNVATVSNNSVNGTSQTGGVTIDGQAFQNLSGLTVINANTGNNVAINASMNVNIAINPGL